MIACSCLGLRWFGGLGFWRWGLCSQTGARLAGCNVGPLLTDWNRVFGVSLKGAFKGSLRDTIRVLGLTG